jgi:hypothetical protein
MFGSGLPSTPTVEHVSPFLSVTHPGSGSPRSRSSQGSTSITSGNSPRGGGGGKSLSHHKNPSVSSINSTGSATRSHSGYSGGTDRDFVQNESGAVSAVIRYLHLGEHTFRLEDEEDQQEWQRIISAF